MRTGAPGPLMRGVLFLIKDGQAIITIIIRSCTMELASLGNGWENPPTGPRRSGDGSHIAPEKCHRVHVNFIILAWRLITDETHP